MPVTLKDIAERVGKSVPTVSRALGNYEDISPETRREVQRMAAEMGYVPSAAARSLQKQQADNITLILPATRNIRFSDPFFSELLGGLVEGAVQHGFDVSINMDGGVDELQTYSRQMRSGRTDGFVVIRTQRQDSRIDFLRRQKIPFIAFGRIEGENDFPFVDEDGTLAMHQVVDHLVGLGHTRIACITEPMFLTKAFHRYQGFVQGLTANGLSLDPNLVVEVNYRQRSGRLGASKLLDLANPPTAIVAWNDLLALGAMSEAQSRGLEVGRDLSITGFDDIQLAEYAHPALTTIRQPAHQLGIMLSDILVRTIEKKPVDAPQVIVKPELVIRQSSGPCPPESKF